MAGSGVTLRTSTDATPMITCDGDLVSIQNFTGSDALRSAGTFTIKPGLG